MADYIKYEDVQMKLDDLASAPKYQHEQETFYDGLSALNIELNSLPTADITTEIQMSKWLVSYSQDLEGCLWATSKCSVCQKTVPAHAPNLGYEFCPFCGTKIEAVVEEFFNG